MTSLQAPRLTIFAMFLCLLWSFPIRAADVETRTVTTADKSDITVNIYPADGERLFIWLTHPLGIQAPDRELAEKLADLDIEVWVPELLEAYFLPTADSSMDRLPPAAIVAVLQEAASTGKQIYLGSSGRAAVPLLRGIRQWQLEKPGDTRLYGAVLLSPNLFIETPDPGEAAALLPIAEATNFPILILQPEQSPWFWKLNQTVGALRKGGSEVQVWRLAKLRGRFYFRLDATDIEKDAGRNLAMTISQALAQLPATSTPRVAVKKIRKDTPVREGKKERSLAEYRGDPNPPPLKLPTLNGKTIDLGKMKGRVVIVNFWASWCPPCVHEMPSMQRLQNRYRKKPFDILGVNMAEEAPVIRQFVNEQVNVTFPILLDRNGAALKAWNVFAFPTTYVIDKHGKIRYALFGGFDWYTPDVIKKIDALLAE